MDVLQQLDEVAEERPGVVGSRRRLGASHCRRCGAILDPGASYLRVFGLLTLGALLLLVLLG